jgi:hypothetical protein
VKRIARPRRTSGFRFPLCEFNPCPAYSARLEPPRALSRPGLATGQDVAGRCTSWADDLSEHAISSPTAAAEPPREVSQTLTVQGPDPVCCPPALHRLSILLSQVGAPACPEPILKAKDLGAGPSYDHWFSALGRLPRRVSCHTPVAVNRVPVSIRDGSGRIGRERHAEPLTSDIDTYITRSRVPLCRP